MFAQAVASAAARGVDLARFAISPGLSRQATGHLTAVRSLQKKSPGETLFSEGDEAGTVHEVVRGMLRPYKLLPDGRRQITGFPSAGHLFGLAPEGVCVYTEEAITEVTLCRYKRTAFNRLIDQVPGFEKRLTVTSREWCAAQNQMFLLGRKAAMEKVVTFPLFMADQQGSDGAEAVDVPMTRTDIADYLGETGSRTLTKLKRDRVIAISSPASRSVIETGSRNWPRARTTRNSERLDLAERRRT